MQQPASTENLLETDHASLGDLIEHAVTALEERDVERSFARLDHLWARLAVHIRAEHHCLFPSILESARQLPEAANGSPQFTEAQDVIDQLRRDHDFFMKELADAIKVLRKLRSCQDSMIPEEELQGVRRRVDTIITRLKKHNETEENLVYRWPAILLDLTQQVALIKCLRGEIENIPARLAGRSEHLD